MTDPVGKRRKRPPGGRNLKHEENRIAMVGLYMLAAIIVLSVFGPLLSPYDYAAQNYTDGLLLFPCAAHIFGTVNFGRDILTREFWWAAGTRCLSPSSASPWRRSSARPWAAGDAFYPGRWGQHRHARCGHFHGYSDADVRRQHIVAA